MHRRITAIVFTLFSAYACAGTAVHRPTSTGKEYYIVFPKAAWGNQSVGVVISSPTKQRIAVVTPNGLIDTIVFKSTRTSQYYGRQFRIESTPEVVQAREATRLLSTDPISVIGQFGVGGISGTYTAMPVTSWGKEYFAVAPPEGQNSTYEKYPAVYSVPMITVIGASATTHVTITPTATTATGHQPGVPYTIIVNAGDVYSLTTAGDPQATNRAENACDADLTGSHLVADKPIGVIVAQTHTSWPCGDNEHGDYCVEWLPPVNCWDSTYVVVPAPTPGPVGGNSLRLIVAHDRTSLYANDTVIGPRLLGTFNAGDVVDYDLLRGPTVFSAGQPFLCAQFHHDSAGGAWSAWPLGMVIVPGVHQWSSFVPFSTAIGSQSGADIVFRDADRDRITLNGTPLDQLSIPVLHATDGFAFVSVPLNAGTYQELSSDSGVSVGGCAYGYGTLRFAPGDKGARTIQDPEDIKSFAHAIGGNMTPIFDDDTVAPRASLGFDCGTWTGVVFEDSTGKNANATGVYDVWLGNSAQDTSYNVLLTVPHYEYGDRRVGVKIDVASGYFPGQAALHVRDGAGNELDTVLVYGPMRLSAHPSVVALDHVPAYGAASASLFLTNNGAGVIPVSDYRLASIIPTGWRILSDASPRLPLLLAPGDSAKFMVQFTAPAYGDPRPTVDTLLIASCGEFPVSVLDGATSPLAFTSETGCYDFGSAAIDSAGRPGDTISSDANIVLTNRGRDPYYISRAVIARDRADHDPSSPASDFTLVAARTTRDSLLGTPSSASPWILDSTADIVFTIRAHPHHAGLRRAWMVITDDWERPMYNSFHDSLCIIATGTALTGIDAPAPVQPSARADNYPNPFSDGMTIDYELGASEHVTIRVTNMLGTIVETLFDGRESPGAHTVQWRGAGMRSGAYLVEIIAGGNRILKSVAKIAND